ncbi:hypothetical protein D3C80_1210940 [compost metagenome]
MATVTINLAALERIAEDRAVKGIQRAALASEAITKANLSRPGTGRIYGKHQASAPGEPPAADSGELRRKTQADTQVRREGQDLVGRLVQNVEYAHALAVGTEKMAPRPSLQLLATDHADDLRDAFIQGARE